MLYPISNLILNRSWKMAARLAGARLIGRLGNLGALVVVLTLNGCGGRAVDLVPVEGKVVRSDGKAWPRKGLVFFAPASAAPGLPLRGAFARFDTDGNFAAGTYEPGDGVVPGQYLVSLQCWEVPPGSDGKVDGKSCIPSKYHTGSQSGLKLDVPADDSEAVIVEFEIPAT